MRKPTAMFSKNSASSCEVGGHVEDELVAARLQVIAQEGADPPVGIGLGFGQQRRLPVLAQPEERHRHPGRRLAAAEVQDMGADGGA